MEPRHFLYGAIVVLAASIVLTGCQHCEIIKPPTEQQNFLMLGDSQMAGQGEMEYEAPDPHVTMFGYDGVWKEAYEPTGDLSGQTHGNSCGLAFAKAFRQSHPSIQVGLIPCGINGTVLYQWEQHGAAWALCEARIRAAANTGQLAGIIIHLGTNDAYPYIGNSNAQHWGEHFIPFLYQLKTDLGNVPIVFAQGGDHFPKASPDTYWNFITSQQATISIQNVRMIKTADLSIKADGVHLDTAGLRILGQRYAAAMSEYYPTKRCTGACFLNSLTF